MATHPQLLQMLEVQNLERELVKLKGQAEAISIPLERTRARRAAQRKDLLTLKEKLERTIQQRRDKERELAELEDKLKTTQDRLSSARNAKEAQAHEAEIERAKAAKMAAEDEVLSLLEREEQLAPQVEQTSAKVDRDLEQINAEMDRLGVLLEENQKLAEGLRADRIAALNGLEADVRKHYEWLLKRYGPGQAVAKVDGGACGGCGSILLPDQALKVDDLSELRQCSHCARYLGGRF